MSAARRTRRSSRPTARRCGSPCAARTTSPCSMPTAMRRRPHHHSRGPGMQIFSPDGKYGYICSSFNPETASFRWPSTRSSAQVKQESPFCPNIAATPDGKQVWFTLKDVGKTQVFNARPPFNLIKTLDTGPITNHVNFAHNSQGHVRLCHRRRPQRGQGVPHRRLRAGRDDPGRQAAARRVAFGRRYAHLCRPRERRRARGHRHRHQHGDRKHADRSGTAGDGLCPGRGAGPRPRRTCSRSASPGRSRTSRWRAKGGAKERQAPTSVSLFDQGLIQVLQASVTGLEPKQQYVLALARQSEAAARCSRWRLHDQSGRRGHRQRRRPDPADRRPGRKADERYLVIASGEAAMPGGTVQIETR